MRIRDQIRALLKRVLLPAAPPEPIWMNKNPRYAKYQIGDWTYGRPNVISWGSPSESLTIGKFCSLAWDSSILIGGEHAISAVTTYPFAQLWPQHQDYPAPALTKGGVRIGNDVWVGRGATVLSGVAVGNGAIIGAEAVIAKDVPAWAVVVGNPGRIIRYRFDEAAIARLESIAWWDWPDEEVVTALSLLSGPIENFLAEFAKKGSGENDLYPPVRKE